MSITSVAIAYTIDNDSYMFTSVCGRRISSLKTDMEALGLQLNTGNIAEIETGDASSDTLDCIQIIQPMQPYQGEPNVS
ncbi:hypothetical protein BDV38DRAFT_281979 [Aspergillus pseudotamarii]|uniref:Uncharacterized protein n=1 Tax=Aspergillus pseudotamarii TaxID=132259 RepID=A0A5N6SVM8_ASPPS|nr:uncharacterized protein BDV38DRAFT_281979 [Aspergillus pseudotamarii]KAE8138682.1 hypothetical protein BDV38DRAFT_281979 [Aspergillus pseudotamarii]